MTEWLTIAEACKRAKVSSRTMYNWKAKGLLDTSRTPGGSLRIDAESLFRNRQVATAKPYVPAFVGQKKKQA